MDDLDKMEGGSAGGVDPAYAAMFGDDGLGNEEAERQVGFEPIMQFPFYVVKPIRAFAGETQTGAPRVAVQVEVLEGPDGTVGRKVLDMGGIYFAASDSRKAKKNETGDEFGRVKRTDDETLKARKNLKGSLLRIQNHLKLSVGFPASFAPAAIEVYAEQFENAQPFVVEIQNKVGRDGVRRNSLNWYSVAALDAPVKDSSGKPTGKTAVQEAREKIITRDKTGAKRGRGSTSRQFATRPAASQADPLG